MPNLTIDTIIKLPKAQKIAIISAVIVVVVGLYIWLLYIPQYQTFNSRKTELVKLQIKLAEQKKIVADLPRFEKELSQLEVQFKEALTLLPNTREIPSLLTNISNLARDCGLEILLFQPKPEIEESFYAQIPVEMKTIGRYHNLGLFFDRVSKLPRIVNILDISMGKKSMGKNEAYTGNVDASFKAVTYKFLEVKKDSDKKKGKDKKKT